MDTSGGGSRGDAFGKSNDALLGGCVRGVVRRYGHWWMLKGGFGG